MFAVPAEGTSHPLSFPIGRHDSLRVDENGSGSTPLLAGAVINNDRGAVCANGLAVWKTLSSAACGQHRRLRAYTYIVTNQADPFVSSERQADRPAKAGERLRL